MIKAVLFDLDGTLVNSLEDLADSCNYALSSFGFATHETDKYRYFVGDGMQKLVERILPEDSRTPEIKERVFDLFMNRYREHFCDKTAPYGGINELLSALRLSGYRLAVISNKAQEMASAVAESCFGSVFDIVCGKREDYPAKPDPALTLEIISELGVTPEECVLVGDSGMDAAAAVNAGCCGIGVLWGFRTEEELRLNGASYTVSSPDEILAVLKELEK